MGDIFSSDMHREWLDSALEDYSVAEVDFNAGKYRHCLINCHHALASLTGEPLNQY